MRIHIVGASGSGTTTLGRAAAAALSVPHFDTDDYFWLPSDPPYVTPRPLEQRLPLLRSHLPADGGWVLSGSALKWSEPLEPLYDLVVFLRLDTQTRLARLRQREHARYGARIAPGGDMAERSAEFLDWAATYDTAGPNSRSLQAHEAWLKRQAAPILRLNTERPVAALLNDVLAQIASAPARGRKLGENHQAPTLPSVP